MALFPPRCSPRFPLKLSNLAISTSKVARCVSSCTPSSKLTLSSFAVAACAVVWKSRPSCSRRQLLRCKLKCSARSEDGDEFDVVVIGAGIGGLSCAGLLASTGRRVVVCESHSVAGGVAHSFKRKGYEFDSGPSLLSGMSSPTSSNPLRHVLNALGEDCNWATYPGWKMVTPEGDFDFRSGDQAHWEQVLLRFGGNQALSDWRKLMHKALPLGEASKLIPANAIRDDLGVLLTLGKYVPRFGPLLLNGSKFQAPFRDLISEAGVTSPFVRSWCDYLCFVLQALPADSHPTAPVVYMLSDMHQPGTVLDYPTGGMGELIDALVRGSERQGVEIRYGSHVDSIVIESGRAQGVELRGGKRLRALEAVVSNASVWDTQRLLHSTNTLPKLKESGSFMHLHLGLRADSLPTDLPLHHSVIRSWKEPIDNCGNVVILSMPTVVNPALAPPGRHCLHAYLAATEPYELWQDFKQGTPEYESFKRERAQPLFEAVERAIPGALNAIDLELIGSPLTHAKFNRRHRGTYGPLQPASSGMLSGPRMAGIDGLLCCGDSTFPGIGVPTAAASGCSAAAALMSVQQHLDIIGKMKIP